MLTQVEVYEFVTNPPDRYFAYVNLDKRIITTWTGDKLGDITFRSAPHTSNMGDVRVNIRVKAVNGLNYAGTFYQSAGDYCRIRKVK